MDQWLNGSRCGSSLSKSTFHKSSLDEFLISSSLALFFVPIMKAVEFQKADGTLVAYDVMNTK